MFWFDKPTFLQISYIIKDHFPTGKNAIDPEKRLGIFLSYVGGNKFQSKTGHLAGVKKGSVCSIIKEVARALVARHKECIKWPEPEGVRATWGGWVPHLACWEAQEEGVSAKDGPGQLHQPQGISGTQNLVTPNISSMTTL